MMARSRQRSGGLFVPPPASLPDDDPYGDVPATPEQPQESASSQPDSTTTSSPAPTKKKRATKAAVKKTPTPTVGEGQSAAAAAPAATPVAAGAPGAKVSASADLEATAGSDVQVQLYIPAALHAAIADYKAEHWRGTDVPTYAQLSVWACEDHREEVIERAKTIHGLRSGMTKDVRGNRSPRGTRRAKPQVPIGPRYSPGDAAFLQELTEEAGTVDDKRVRRTTLVAASLAVAVKHPPQARPAEPTEPVDEFFG
uniref:Uncharacterized protein n=2 Tax=Intrasporangiaceae TaxID=85021 RepID=Q3MNR8_TERSD|nr:hypothetical protein [Terrabacter sp. DBF63]